MSLGCDTKVRAPLGSHADTQSEHANPVIDKFQPIKPATIAAAAPQNAAKTQKLGVLAARKMPSF